MASNAEAQTRPRENSQQRENGPESPHNAKSAKAIPKVQKELIPYLTRIHTHVYYEHMQKEIAEQEFQSMQGWAAKILRIPGFEYFMGTVIVLNLCVMIVETDRSTTADVDNSEQIHWTEVFGWIALVIFVVEMIARLFVFRCVFWKDYWNVFDFIIVSTDTVFSLVGLVAGKAFPVSILRIFRLAKLARVSKVLRVFPELRLLLAGLMSSISAIFWGTLLLLFCLLVWSMVAVLFIHPLNKDIDYVRDYDCERCARAYSSVFQATLTFWQQIVTGDSWGAATIPVIERHPITALFFIPVYLSVGMAVTNLILGVVVSVAQQAKDDLMEEENTEKAFNKLKKQTHLLELCRQMDSNNSGELNHDEVLTGFEVPGDFRDIILALDISREDFDIVWAILDSENKGAVSYKDLVSHLCTLRSSDNQFMLAYIKYYITMIRNMILDRMYDHHQEAMSMRRSVEESIQNIACNEGQILEEEKLLLDCAAHGSSQALLNSIALGASDLGQRMGGSIALGEQEEPEAIDQLDLRLRLAAAEGTGRSIEPIDLERCSPAEAMEMLNAREHNLKQRTWVLQRRLEDLEKHYSQTVPPQDQRQCSVKSTIDASEGNAPAFDGMQTWCNKVCEDIRMLRIEVKDSQRLTSCSSDDIRTLRIELKDILLDMNRKIDPHVSSASAADKDTRFTNAQPVTLVGESSKSILSSFGRTSVPEASGSQNDQIPRHSSEGIRLKPKYEL